MGHVNPSDYRDARQERQARAIGARATDLAAMGPYCACGAWLGPVGAMLGPSCGACVRAQHRAMVRGAR